MKLFKNQLLVLLVISLLLVGGGVLYYIVQTSPAAPIQEQRDKVFSFKNKQESLEFFKNYISKKITSSDVQPKAQSAGMLAAEDVKKCELDNDCLLVSNYFQKREVSCKKDSEAPGNYPPCPTPNSQVQQSSADLPLQYVPPVDDPRYEWRTSYFFGSLNPLNLISSEREKLEIVESVLWKNACQPLTEQNTSVIESNKDNINITSPKSKYTSVPGSPSVPPPVPVEGTVGEATSNSIYGLISVQKYCALSPRKADLIIANIDISKQPLKRGAHSFPLGIKNIGADKSCETFQITELYKNGQDLGGIGLRVTYECLINPQGDGIDPNEVINSATGMIDFNETGVYTLKSNIKSFYPGEENLENGSFETQIEIVD